MIPVLFVDTYELLLLQSSITLQFFEILYMYSGIDRVILNLLNISIKLYFDTDKWTQVILSVSGFQTMTLDPKVRSQ